MSLDIRYAKIDPEQIKDVYTEFDTVDFLIATDRNVIANSIRLEGDLRFLHDGTNRVTNAQTIFYEPKVGMHGLIESISTQMGGSGEVVEFLQNYPRYVNMVEKATNGENDYFSGQKVVEGKVPCYELSRDVMRGKVLFDDQNTNISDADFSLKPMFCLNRMDGQSLNLSPYNNLVKVSVQLARNKAFFCGTGAVDTTAYQIRNLKVTYRTLPSSPSPNVSSNSYVSLKQTIQSPQASISTRVPAIASGVSMSFQLQGEENTNGANNYETQKPPFPSGIGLRFMFNNVSNNFITYEIVDEGEAVENYLESLKSGGVNALSPTEQRGANFGLGVNFQGFVDLRNQKLTFELDSGIDTNVPMLAYMYFHSKIQLS